MNKVKHSFCYILPNIILYKNENGRYIMKETESEQGVSKFPWELEFDEPEDSRTWNVVREYEGSFSVVQAIEEVIRVHMEGRVNV